MKKIEIGQALTVLANIGVIVGIVFVALEVRQTRDAVLGATYMARASAQEDWQKWVADSEYILPAAGRWADTDFSQLSADDQARLSTAVEAAFHRMDGIYYQYELGLLPQEYYETTFHRLMQIWVPRWSATGMFDRGWIIARPSFQAEIDRYLDEPLLVK